MVLPKRLLSPFYYLFLLFLLLYNAGYAQNCTPVFHKTYHGSGQDEALDIYINSDKGSIVAGRTTTNSAKWDGFLLRLNEQGDIIWTNSYGGSEYDELTKVRQTTDGGFIALGKTRSFGVSTDEAWIIKTDGNGNLLWSKRFGKNNQPIRPKHVIELTGGGYAFAFNTNDSTSQGDGIIIRTDASGQITWTKVFDNGGDDGINTLYQDGN